MRVLVTGAQGRLGRRLVPALDALGVETIPTCRATLDASDADAVERALVESGADTCVALAASTDVRRCEREPDYCHATLDSARGTAQGCHRAGVDLLYLSSDYVVPLLRDEAVCSYGEAKYLAECVVRAWGGRVVRAAFVTPEQVSGWGWVNAYSVANRAWVEDAARALAALVVNGPRDRLTALVPPPTTPEALLRGRFPAHPALEHRVTTPEGMRARVGYAAPIDSQFVDDRVFPATLVPMTVSAFS